MKKLKRYIAFIIAVVMTFQTDIRITYANEAEKTTTYTANNVTDMYNMAVPIRFDGEEEYLNTKIPEADNITNIQLIDNTYNKSTYSIQEYYKAVSNHTLNLRTVYLTEGEDGFTSIKLNHTRGYYSPKSEQNPEGYTTEGEYRRAELLRDWSDKVQEAIKQGAKLKNIDGDEIDFAKLDSDGDGSIDSITLLFTPTDEKYAAEWSSPLWAYQSENYLIKINTSKGELTSSRYYQAPIQNAASNIYKEAGSDIYFSNPKTLTHEMGHIFGLLDLYPFSGDNRPMHYMSSMGFALSPVVQFMTSREREAAGWLNGQNITPITKAGTYTLEPVTHERQDGTIAYTLELPNNRKLYMEYRYVDEKSVNKFDFNASKRKLYYANGNEVNAIGLNKSGLLICDADMSRKFPSNSSGTPQLSAIGGQYNTKIDAPRAKGESVTYGGYTISVTDLNKDKITFKVSGNDLGKEEQPGIEGRPSENGVTLLAPSEIGDDLSLTVTQGSQIQFLAVADGKKLTDKDILWSVNNETDADTEIDEKSGLLKIGANESTTNELQIAGQSDDEWSKIIRIKVKVISGSKTYSVTYLPGEDSKGVIESSRKIDGKSLSLKGALYTKTGFAQTGWSLSEGGEKVYELNGEFDLNSPVILYPYWSKTTTTESPKPTASATVSPKPTASATVSPKPTASATVSPKPTASATVSPKPTASATVSPKPTASATVSPKPTASATVSPEPTASATVSPKPTTPSNSGSGGGGSNSVVKPTASALPTLTAAPTEKPTVSETATPKPTASVEPKPTMSETATPKPTASVEPKPTASVAPTSTVKPTTPSDIIPTVSETPAATPSVSEKPDIILSAKSMVLDTGATKKGKITAKIVGTDEKAVFKSSNSKVVKVDKDGNLTALKAGKATISVSVDGVTSFCNIVVKKASIKVDHTSLVLYISKTNTEKLNVKVSGASSKVTFKSRNSKIVKVDASGKLMAIKPGKTSIVIKANGKTSVCKIKVRKIALKISKNNFYLNNKKSTRLKVSIVGPSKKIKYKSSNARVIKVNGKGKVTAIRKGTAYIIVSANGIKKKCKITVI